MAFQCSWLNIKLKQKLLKHLREVCTFNPIIKFCDLLILGQRLIKRSKNGVIEDSDRVSKLLQKSDAILEQIKDIIASVSAEVLIQKLFRVLDKESEDVDRWNLKLCLLQINNHESSITSLEYLEGLIRVVDNVIKSYWNSELYSRYFLFSDPVKNLPELNRLVHCATFKSTMKILDIISKVVEENVEVTSAEKKQWQCLLLEAADIIKKFVKWDVSFECTSLQSILRMRFCIQCVLDLLTDCPVEYGILLKGLDKIKDCKEICDCLIEQKRKRPAKTDIDDYSDNDEESDIIDHIEISDDREIDDYVDILNNVGISDDTEIKVKPKMTLALVHGEKFKKDAE